MSTEPNHLFWTRSFSEDIDTKNGSSDSSSGIHLTLLTSILQVRIRCATHIIYVFVQSVILNRSKQHYCRRCVKHVKKKMNWYKQSNCIHSLYVFSDVRRWGLEHCMWVEDKARKALWAQIGTLVEQKVNHFDWICP